MANFFGLDKLQKLASMIKYNGGMWSSFMRLFVTDDLRMGKLVGTDKLGNKYYEDNTYFMGRNRYVIYQDKVGFNYDASQIAPEWHAWMHYMTDKPPTVEKPVQYKWMQQRQTENFTGTSEAYMPYSTTRPKIQPWVPPSSNK